MNIEFLIAALMVGILFGIAFAVNLYNAHTFITFIRNKNHVGKAVFFLILTIILIIYTLIMFSGILVNLINAI